MKLRSLSRDEEGGILAIVVVCLVVILGMVALTVDFGSSYVKRRSMVNSADAAALGFAVWCATGKAAATADAQADATATSNTAGAVRTSGSPTNWPVTGSCAPGTTSNAGSVSVSYQGQANQYFAPIVGRPSTQRVVAKATAAWGAAGGAGSVLPIMLNEQRLSTCDIPNGSVGDECYFYLDNSPSGYGTAQWALMNVQPNCGDGHFGWNVTTACAKVRPGPTYSCPAFSTAEMINLINSGSPPLTLNAPNPTYVCNASGAKTPVFRDVQSLAGQVRLFPVNDPNGQILNGGAPAPPPMTPDFYDVVGFIQMQIVHVWNGKDAGWSPNCPGVPNSNAWCLHAIWLGFTTDGSGGICNGCQNFGVEAVELQG
jgi:Flp pilus assembly protein TadG